MAGERLTGAAAADRFAGATGLLFDQAMAQTRMAVCLTDPSRADNPIIFANRAFFALTGICTVGLYLAYILPVFLRLRAGASFEPGPWNLGRKYRVVNVLAIIFVIAVVYSLNLPYDPSGLPWNDNFEVANVNYTPFAILLPLIFGVWYLVSAKDRYQGPVRTLEEDEVTAD